MGPIASQITSLTIVYSIVYSDADQRKHQSSASLAFVRGIHRGRVNSPHKWPVTRKMFSFDDVIMSVLDTCFWHTRPLSRLPFLYPKWIFIVLVWYLKIHEWPTTTELRLQEGGGTYEKLIKAYCIRTLFNGYATGRWWHNLRSTVHGQQKHTPPLRTLGKPSMCVICVEWSKVYALQESLHIFIIWQIVFTMGSNEFILCCGKISWRCVKSLASLPNELHFIYVLQNINAYILC